LGFCCGVGLGTPGLTFFCRCWGDPGQEAGRPAHGYCPPRAIIGTPSAILKKKSTPSAFAPPPATKTRPQIEEASKRTQTLADALRRAGASMALRSPSTTHRQDAPPHDSPPAEVPRPILLSFHRSAYNECNPLSSPSSDEIYHQ
jgi:hypothetical protein